jgi:hypothetical protein
MHVLLIDFAILAGMAIAYARDSQSGLPTYGLRSFESFFKTLRNFPYLPVFFRYRNSLIVRATHHCGPSSEDRRSSGADQTSGASRMAMTA